MRLTNSSWILLDAEIVWCQEEPMNMGAFYYISPRLYTTVRALGRGTIDDIKYVGRAPSAASATGFYSVHVKEQTELVQKALQREPINFWSSFQKLLLKKKNGIQRSIYISLS